MSPSSSRRVEILERLAPGNLFQPATALWRAYEIEAVVEHVRFRGRVLDVGCGDGTLSSVIFNGSNVEIIGLELDPGDAELARQSGIYRSVHCAPGAAVPENDASFDIVFSNSVLEHIPDLSPVLAESARVLRSGGELVVTVPSEQFHDCLTHGGPLSLLWKIRGQSPREAIDRRLQHHRYWSPEEWKAALEPLGFKRFDFYRYLPAAALQAWERISNLTGGLLFELFGRKSETRQLQKKLSLGKVDTLIPAQVRAMALTAVLRRSIQSEMRDNQPSGGLLVIAHKD